MATNQTKAEPRLELVKSDFVSVVSHQLRTPLTAIKLFVEMLLNEDVGELNLSQKEYIGNIEQSTERMIRLVNDLLNVSRLEAGKMRVDPQKTNLIIFLREMIDEIEPIANAWNCNIVFDKPEERVDDLPIDQALMQEVIHNLIMNAIKYSKHGGAEIIVGLKKKDDKLIISVQDFGIGIPEEDRPKIFTKFYRTDNAINANPEGSGLGLFVVQQIIKLTGGEIWYESEVDQGTTFYISLPASGMDEMHGEKGIVD